MGRFGFGPDPSVRFIAGVEGGDDPVGGIGFAVLTVILELVRLAIPPEEPERVDGKEKQLLLLWRLCVFAVLAEEFLRFKDLVENRHGATAEMEGSQTAWDETRAVTGNKGRVEPPMAGPDAQPETRAPRRVTIPSRG